jgi:hypothetical protein
MSFIRDGYKEVILELDCRNFFQHFCYKLTQIQMDNCQIKERQELQQHRHH